MKQSRALAPTAVLAAVLTAAGAGAFAQDSATAPASERFAACLACHGERGVSALPLTPSLAGQPSFYAITQLFLFREGRRQNEAMTAVAKGMSDADLRAFSELIGKLPAPPASPASGAAAGDAARIARGKALAAQHRCASCHGADYAGGQQVARLAGQREDYLSKALVEFRNGERVGYTSAMSEALAALEAEELKDVAHYLARAP